MNLDQLLQFLRNRPFVPFRLHLMDGQTFEIRHPELVVVQDDRVILGLTAVRRPGGEAYACTADEIARVESLEQPAR